MKGQVWKEGRERERGERKKKKRNIDEMSRKRREKSLGFLLTYLYIYYF